MAKIKQKKLKAENFRYVTKGIIKNPMLYLNDFFGNQTRIKYWERDIHLLVNAAVCSELAKPPVIENGYHCRQLIEQVEVAYVIYKQCNLKKQRRPLGFFKTQEDYWSFVIEGEAAFDGDVNPADTLSKFFSFQSLEKWYKTLDDMMVYLADPTDAYDDRFGDKVVVIRELLLRMARALYDIYDNEGIFVRVPSYFIASPMAVAGEPDGASLTGELSDGMSDEAGDSHDAEAGESAALSTEPEAMGGTSTDTSIQVEKENHQTEEA
ncbi:hypothetical protein JHJ32_17875 [Parapedobacter sp. ISTM3]|uniref:hypothetical protein n=1 Tax=Parapedobacter sp. ISTM3 TaxID=2800130 RepID=UPI0019054326|nr:hypothetical protein [Parapedobacter sp. ISTM3]MBK1441873.1 hypothetical protein [Parapedobacter sp. ISTM3]